MNTIVEGFALVVVMVITGMSDSIRELQRSSWKFRRSTQMINDGQVNKLFRMPEAVKCTIPLHMLS